MQLDLSNSKTVVSELMWKISLSVPGEQVSKHLAASFPFSDFWIFSSLLGYFSKISCTFHFVQMLNGFLLSTLKFGPIIFMYHSKTFRRQVSFCSS